MFINKSVISGSLYKENIFDSICSIVHARQGKTNMSIGKSPAGFVISDK